MPTQEQILNLQARSRMVHSKLVKEAYTAMKLGGTCNHWPTIKAIHQVNIAMDTQVRAADYISADTLGYYKQLLCFVGSQFTGDIPFNPNAQLPGNTIIVVTNPATSTPPIPRIPYDWFSPDTQQGDGGRIDLFLPQWKGLNPILEVTAPVSVALDLGIDYTLIPNGGISLLPSSAVLAAIYPEGTLRASGYVEG